MIKKNIYKIGTLLILIAFVLTGSFWLFNFNNARAVDHEFVEDFSTDDYMNSESSLVNWDEDNDLITSLDLQYYIDQDVPLKLFPFFGVNDDENTVNFDKTFEVDENGDVHVIYLSIEEGSHLMRYTKLSNGVYYDISGDEGSDIIFEGLAADELDFYLINLSLTSDNYPVVEYTINDDDLDDDANDDEVYITYYNGSTWIDLTLSDGISEDHTFHTSEIVGETTYTYDFHSDLEIDDNDDFHLVFDCYYQDEDGTDLKLCYTKFDISEGTWIQANGALGSEFVPSNTSAWSGHLAIDSQNRPHVVLFLAEQLSYVHYYYDGSDWVGIEDGTTDGDAFSGVPESYMFLMGFIHPVNVLGYYVDDIQIDDDDNIHLVYYYFAGEGDDDATATLYYTMWNGSDWVTNDDVAGSEIIRDEYYLYLDSHDIPRYPVAVMSNDISSSYILMADTGETTPDPDPEVTTMAAYLSLGVDNEWTYNELSLSEIYSVPEAGDANFYITYNVDFNNAYLNVDNDLNITSLSYWSQAIYVSAEIDEFEYSYNSATLTATSTVLEDSSISYFLSNDDGANWTEVASGEELEFSELSTQLIWKAVLESTAGSTAPELSNVEISYSAILPNVASDAPTLSSPSDEETDVSTTPTFEFSATDSNEDDSIKYIL